MSIVYPISNVIFRARNIVGLLNGNIYLKRPTFLHSVKLSYSRTNAFLFRNVYLSKVKVDIDGDNNKLVVKGSIYNTQIVIDGNNNYVRIEDQSLLFNSRIFIKGSNLTFTLGRKTSVGQMNAVCMGHSNSIEIGQECMIADNVEIYNTDTHQITDLTSKMLLNPSQPVIIGNNVWVGKNSTILKGVSIGDGSIIGYGALITKDVPPHVVVVGNNRIVKQNVGWSRSWTDE